MFSTSRVPCCQSCGRGGGKGDLVGCPVSVAMDWSRSRRRIAIHIFRSSFSELERLVDERHFERDKRVSYRSRKVKIFLSLLAHEFFFFFFFFSFFKVAVLHRTECKSDGWHLVNLSRNQQLSVYRVNDVAPARHPPIFMLY